MLIDIHAHTALTTTVKRKDGSALCTPEQLLSRLDELKIDMAVLLPLVSPECAYRYATPEDILETAARFPDRFIPFCNLDPRMAGNSPDADFSPLLEYYRTAGCKGVGEVSANLLFDDPLVWNMLDHCSGAGMPVTFHMAPQPGGCYGLVDDIGLPRLQRTLARFPNLILLGHSQPFWSEISADVTNDTRGGYPDGKVSPGSTVRLMRECPNLHGDLSARSGYNAVSRDPEFGYAFMEEFQDRLYFGTDICAPHGQAPLVGFLRNAAETGMISHETFEKISWRNASRLLELGME